jgi:NitT/TauT family transport system substrate-binding protein
MRVWHRIPGLAAAVWLALGLAGAAQAEPLRIFYFNWAGYGPFFLAQEKGFFAREGIEVELINVEETHAAYAGLSADHVDAIAAALPDIPFFATPEDSLVCVLVTDDSRGGDGVVASNDIRSIADLKGKAVTFEKGSISHFYLSVLLKDAGLREADLEVVDVPDADGATAFLLGEVDATVTWGRMLVEAKQAPHGHLLADSSQHPGLLVSCLITTPGVLGLRRSDFQALGRAWDAAVDYVNAHPDEAIQIMAHRMGGAHGDPKLLAEVLETIELYDGERNREFFGTPEDPGQIYRTAQQAIDVWSSLGRAQAQIAPADVIRHDIWDE